LPKNCRKKMTISWANKSQMWILLNIFLAVWIVKVKCNALYCVLNVGWFWKIGVGGRELVFEKPPLQSNFYPPKFSFVFWKREFGGKKITLQKSEFFFSKERGPLDIYFRYITDFYDILLWYIYDIYYIFYIFLWYSF
jgi:hypothetical protein